MSLFQKTPVQQVSDALGLFEGVKTKLAAAVAAGHERVLALDEKITTLRTERGETQDAIGKAINALRGITALLEGKVQ